MKDLLYSIRSLLIVIFSPLLSLWYIRYWFKVHSDYLPDDKIAYANTLGYTDKMFYYENEKVKFYLSSEKKIKIRICIAVSAYEDEEIESFNVDSKQQNNQADPKTGCNWELSFELSLAGYKQGYYKVFLNNEFIITFIVAKQVKKADVLVIAPVSTWVAYNHFGGQSVYDNYKENKTVHFVSAQRPNLALTYNPIDNIHDMPVEINIYKWFESHCNTAIIPDYMLETAVPDCKIAVLSYHCEYVSKKMYDALRKTKISLISLGGNQVFWKIKWSDNYQTLEVRKDVTFFENSLKIGGGWRHSFQPEDRLLGVRYTEAGIGTFSPYKVTNPTHFLYNGLEARKGELFGEKGINELGICGDETDVATLISNVQVEVIAEGLNPKDGELYQNYNGDNKVWDGKGGGQITYKEENGRGVLSTGAIQSGSGLGTDKVFTQIISNFIARYL